MVLQLKKCLMFFIEVCLKINYIAILYYISHW